jgi:hypothetical protein
MKRNARGSITAEPMKPLAPVTTPCSCIAWLYRALAQAADPLFTAQQVFDEARGGEDQRKEHENANQAHPLYHPAHPVHRSVPPRC